MGDRSRLGSSADGLWINNVVQVCGAGRSARLINYEASAEATIGCPTKSIRRASISLPEKLFYPHNSKSHGQLLEQSPCPSTSLKQKNILAIMQFSMTVLSAILAMAMASPITTESSLAESQASFAMKIALKNRGYALCPCVDEGGCGCSSGSICICQHGVPPIRAPCYPDCGCDGTSAVCIVSISFFLRSCLAQKSFTGIHRGSGRRSADNDQGT